MLEGSASITYGTDDRLFLKGRISVPLGERAALSISAGSFTQDGYINMVNKGQKSGDRDTQTARARLDVELSETLSAQFAIDGTRTRANGAPLVIREINLASNIFNPAGLALAPPGFPLNPDGTAAVPALLPPGVDPATRFYAINPPADSPLDNFPLLHNYLTTFLGGQDCLSGFFQP